MSMAVGSPDGDEEEMNSAINTTPLVVKQSTTAILCRAWDGSKLERIRGGDGVTVLYDRRLAAHLMVQPGVAAGFLSDSQFSDQGLLGRVQRLIRRDLPRVTRRTVRRAFRC